MARAKRLREVDLFDVHLLWHARIHTDPAFLWFRDHLTAVHAQAYA